MSLNGRLEIAMPLLVNRNFFRARFWRLVNREEVTQKRCTKRSLVIITTRNSLGNSLKLDVGRSLVDLANLAIAEVALNGVLLGKANTSQ